MSLPALFAMNPSIIGTTDTSSFFHKTEEVSWVGGPSMLSRTHAWTHCWRNVTASGCGLTDHSCPKCILGVFTPAPRDVHLWSHDWGRMMVAFLNRAVVPLWHHVAGVTIAWYCIKLRGFTEILLCSFMQYWRQSERGLGGKLLAVVVVPIFPVSKKKKNTCQVKSCILGMLPSSVTFLWPIWLSLSNEPAAEQSKRVNVNTESLTCWCRVSVIQVRVALVLSCRQLVPCLSSYHWDSSELNCSVSKLKSSINIQTVWHVFNLFSVCLSVASTHDSLTLCSR